MTAPLRIVFVSHYALPHMGGIEVVVDQLARQLVARGHDVVHVAAASLREDDERTADAPYEVVRLGAWNALERIGLPYPLFRPGAMRAHVRNADVVHAHGMLFQNCAAALRVARRRGAVRVLTEHVGAVPYGSRAINAIQNVAIRTVGRATARNAQTIVVLNPRVEALMRELAPDVPVIRIDNGVDLARYRPPEQRGARPRPRVLFVGRLVEKKGVSIAIEAARLGGGAWELLVAGPGTPPTGDAPHVQFLGALPAERVAELYRDVDLFLLPSKGEGFPLTAQEAMASGLPIVLGDDPAYGPILEGSGRGATLVAQDAAAVAHAIRELLPVASQAGDEAARLARARFDWSRTAERHLELYERLRRKA